MVLGLPSPISFAYDAASRVTQEALNGQWSVSYGYDTAGNRTSVNDGTIDKTIGYGVGNRETSVSGGIDPLGYDYKGNVISRMTLDGTKTYHYGWDAFDRLTSATQMWSGGATVGYDYDAMGRLLRRAKASAAGTSTTLNYWLGLNKLAEERIVDDGSTAVVRPDSEASYPEANGWGFYDIGWDFTLQYDEDSVRGQVLTLAAIGGAASMIVGDDSGENYNGNATAWAAQGRRQLGFWFKNDDATPIEITVFGRASSGYGTLVFDTGTGTDYADSGNGCYVYYLGNANRFPTMNDGNWHYIELDLGAYQKQFSGVSGALTHVDGLAFTLPEDCQIQLDDIILSAGALERSYGLIPNATISGYLGAQTGSTGAKDVNTQTQCVDPWSRYYYHFSDLGTVMATSNANGAKLGAYEPDFCGNYRDITGFRPDTMGLTAKFFDNESGLSFFNARWFEQTRGNWVSMDPIRHDKYNSYRFLYNNLTNYYDSTGLFCCGEECENAKKGAKSCVSKCSGWGLWSPQNSVGCGTKAAAQATCLQNCARTLPEPYKSAVARCSKIYVTNHYYFTLWSWIPIVGGFSYMHSQAQIRVDCGQSWTATGRIVNDVYTYSPDTSNTPIGGSNNPEDPQKDYPI